LSQVSNDKPQATAPTPMMQQFIEIKSVNMDSLLFYRMGDFYELFFDDAEIAARALGITLTKRGKHQGEDIPMCGVPVHAAEDYLQKLIGLGYRVAVCEQMEDPSEAKKRGSKAVVRRDVVRLVTPGTVTEEKLLDPSASNYLATLSRIKKGEDDFEMAIAWIDISTGSFRVTRVSQQELGAALARIEPRELIMPESIYSDPDIKQMILLDEKAITIESPTFFDSQMAVERLKDTFNVKSLDGFGSFTKSELSAAGAALAYVEKTQIDERPALMPPSREDDNHTMFIDAATRANLELMRTLSGERKGSLFHAINQTVSGPGGRLLAERMMSPLTDIHQITQRQNSISYLLEKPELAQSLRHSIKKIPDMARALSRLALNRGGPRDLASLLSGMNGARTIVKEFTNSNELPSEFSKAATAINALSSELQDLLFSALADEMPLLARDGGFIKTGYHSELDELKKLRDESRRVIAEMQLQYAEATGVKSLKIKHNNMLGYFIEVTANNADPLMSDEGKATFIHRQTLANAMRFTTTELAEIESKIANAAGKALQIELEIFSKLVANVLENKIQISKTADALAVLDVAQSLAHLAQTYEYCRPKVDDSLAFEIKGGRHPVVEQVLKRDAQNPFVANDCNVGGNEAGKLWLLTGPNMGGKSTFLRQNALIIILAQMGSFVPAMVETAAILNQAEVKSFVILDEIGRGTATFDGLSIAWAAIENLHEANLCRTLFATHYHELTSLAEPLERLSNVTMKVKEWEGDVVFLHEVVAGTADRSYGIQVAKLAGLPPAVIARARDVLDQLESSERTNNAKTLIDDLPLFSVTATEPVIAKTDSKIIEALEKISPDDMSPREAQQALYDLRALLKSQKN